MMVVGPNDLDQLYIAPGHQGHGIGRRLVDLAKAVSPAGLTLYTFQVNERARRFYERNGFTVVPDGEKDRLLRTYWSIPARQIETSVVLADGRWMEGQRRASAHR